MEINNLKVDVFIADQEIFEDMTELLIQYTKASKKFIDKVESGKAKSVETYADLKNAHENTAKFLEKYGYKKEDENESSKPN